MDYKFTFKKRNKKLIIGVPAAIAFLVIVSAIGTAYYYKRIKKSDTKTIIASVIDYATEDNTPIKADIGEFGLSVPQINIWAPIIPDVDDNNEAQYLKAIENGVALSRNHATSPKEKGNLFIFGHSKYYKDRPGNFKEVFKDINSMKVGDRFVVFYKRDNYEYEVVASKAVAADDFSITDATPDDKDDKTLTLMTCWPPGTTSKRWIIFAKQI
ncbi:MAG: sortase [Patescibacteria group bacterium]|jgi:LPXTG-site transpeptidase (sortase) family protein